MYGIPFYPSYINGSMPPNSLSHQKLIKSSSSKAPLPTARCQAWLFDHGSGAVNRFLKTAPKKEGIFLLWMGS
jgi:hypothetical protein